MFAEEQVLAAHDAAHELRSHELHDLAMRLMDLCGIEHITVDEFDPEPDGRNDPWFDAPGCLLLGDSAVSQLGPWEPRDRSMSLLADHIVDGASLTFGMAGLGPRKPTIVRGDPQGIQSPLYDLWLVKKQERRITNTGGLVPCQRVDVGPFREFGRYKFPVVAQEILGERCELHKSGDKCVVLGLDERPADVEEAMRSIDVPQGIWLGMHDGETMWVYDCLLYAYEQTHEKQLSHRLMLLPDAVGALRPLPEMLLEDPAGLLTLPDGRYLIRWAEEVPDLEEPFWFIHEAQRIRVGQPFAPMQWKDGPWDCGVERIVSMVGTGLRAQAHVDAGAVSLFLDGKAWDSARSLGQVASALSSIPVQSAVIDGELTWGGYTTDLRVALNRGDDLSGEDITFVAFDCLHVDGADLHSMPCQDRVRHLSQIIPDGSDNLRKDWMLTDGRPGLPHILRDPDSRYPLDGSGAGWIAVGMPESHPNHRGTDDDEGAGPETTEADGKASTQEDEVALSRHWVEYDGEPVTQDTVPVAMAYQHRHHGLLSDEEVRSAWNELQGPDARKAWKEYGLASLKVPINDLREQYQTAEWNKRKLVLSKAIDRRFPRDLDLTKVVKPVSVDGHLMLRFPANETLALCLTNDIVQASLQFLSSEGRIEHLADDLLISGTNDLFVGAQDQPVALTQVNFDYGDFKGSGFGWPTPPGGVYDIVARGEAILGVQKHDFHEVFLLFDGEFPSGRFVWSYVDVNGDMIWLGRRPEEQTPYIFTHDMAEEIDKARDDSGWIAWNPDGIRAFAASQINASLPINWEERLDPYDDSPFSDFFS